jgi:hypothetical protein
MGRLRYQMRGFRELTSDWAHDEFANLYKILAEAEPEPNTRDGEVSAVEFELHWNYYLVEAPRARARLARLLRHRTTDKEDYTPAVDYRDVLTHVAGVHDVPVTGLTDEDVATYVAERVLTDALSRMGPKDRHRAFTETYEVAMPGLVHGTEKRAAGQAAGVFGALALAQASGFGVE